MTEEVTHDLHDDEHSEDAPLTAVGTNKSKQLQQRLVFSSIKSKSFAKICLFSLFRAVVFTSFIIIMPLYTAQYFGGCLTNNKPSTLDPDCTPNYTKLALYSTYTFPAGAAITFIFSGFVGRLTDSYGRKIFFIINTILWLIPTIMMCFYFDFWIYAVLIIIAQTIPMSIAINGCVADIIKPEKRTNAFGKMDVAMGIGSGLGIVIGNGVSMKWGNNVVFYVSAVGYILLLIYIFIVMDETIDINNNRRAWNKNAVRNPVRPLCRAKQNKLILFICMTSLSVAFASGFLIILPSYIGTEMKLKHENETLILSIYIVIAAVVGAICNGKLLGMMQKKMSDITIMILAIINRIIASILLGLISFYPNLGILFLSALMMGASVLIYPVLTGVISKFVNKSCQGTAFGILKAYNQIALIFSPFISGYFYVKMDQEDMRYMVVILSIFFCCIAIILIIFPLKKKLNEQYSIHHSIQLLSLTAINNRNNDSKDLDHDCHEMTKISSKIDLQPIMTQEIDEIDNLNHSSSNCV